MLEPPAQFGISELTSAICFVTEKLMKRGYLHETDDVVFVRLGHKLVSGCAKGFGLDSPLDLRQLRWASERGSLWFNWYEGTHLRLRLHKGQIRTELKFDPAKDSLWAFVYSTLDGFR